jgi:hypothetical protein
MIAFRRYILCGLLFCTHLLLAQPRLSQPDIFLGVHGGVKASTVLFNPSINAIEILKSPLGFNGGLVFRYAEHKVCALQVECNYMQHGWAEAYGSNKEIVYTRRLHYIELPFLMHLGFGKGNFKAFLNLGPQIGCCLKDSYSLSSSADVKLDQLQHNSLDNLFDWGVMLGLGCYYRSTKAGLFQLEMRGCYSLGSIFEVGALSHYQMANPLGVSVNLAYMWQFKGR